MGEYFNEFLPLGGQVVKCKMQTEQQRNANGMPVCLVEPVLEELLPYWDAALKVMDGVWAPLPSQGSDSCCLLEDLSDRILTIASERFSGTDLPSFRCSQERVHGICSFCCVWGSVPKVEHTHQYTGSIFNISLPTSELFIDEASRCQRISLCIPKDLKIYIPYKKWINLW